MSTPKFQKVQIPGGQKCNKACKFKGLQGQNFFYFYGSMGVFVPLLKA